ncbi:MAG: hypothetical protein MJE66_06005 [Proteobacteria bacterium]|nr:hypothetical protein [Pseudomonadota bacterium]
MSTSPLSLEELTRFGIQPEDEGLHPYDPAVEWWNESWFWDWFDADGQVAGHTRIGLHPVQGRAWAWLFVYRRGEWVGIEEPRLPLSDVRRPQLAYDGYGLSFSYRTTEPLRTGHLEFEGFGRVLSGPRTGLVLPVGVALDVTAVGAAHTTGRGETPGHRSDAYDACRYEQPISLAGTVSIDGETEPFAGRGERDHSWGPRPWNLEWTFLVAHGDDLRLQCTEALIPNVDPIRVGYLQRSTTESLTSVDLDMKFDHGSLAQPLAGHLRVESESGQVVAGRVEVLTAVEIDLTHVLVPPERPIYRRCLIRVHPEDGGESLLGWCEFNRFRRQT